MGAVSREWGHTYGVSVFGLNNSLGAVCPKKSLIISGTVVDGFRNVLCTGAEQRLLHGRCVQ